MEKEYKAVCYHCAAQITVTPKNGWEATIGTTCPCCGSYIATYQFEEKNED